MNGAGVLLVAVAPLRHRVGEFPPEQPHHLAAGPRGLRIVEHGGPPRLGAVRGDAPRGDAVDAERRGVRFGQYDLDGSRPSCLVDAPLTGGPRDPFQSRRNVGDRGRGHVARFVRPGHETDELGARVAGDSQLHQQVGRVVGGAEFLAAVGEQGARGAGGGIERRPQVRHVVSEVRGFLGSRPLELALPLRQPHPHLGAVVAERFDQGLGLQEGVARDGEHTVRVNRHAARQVRAERGGLRREGDSQKTLQQGGVPDPGAQPLVVLGVTEDQPGTAGHVAPGSHHGES
ncbi:hypothetical protein SAMN04487905_101507 [Actinopolyspora xinjiangensis]|uniref:Uncharacterized protein n=1 Tax=Actinopolyspora xinjiangensis TaxID=405564 RepID=A0A1H0PF00_9ACTN|nr:hypothetical protein [Actinopolyspora xinjiangensis]SDP03206.1 hypothetical protein SAMN04487905_101507 [Actinopolyspora xinjiangensis]